MKKSLYRIEMIILLCFVVGAIAYRGDHLRGQIDRFSAWRQAETAYMTRSLYEESPPEYLHSKVPYRGNKDVHLAEFPVQPIITSFLYKLIGAESLFLARCVTLFFFTGGSILFFLVLRIMVDVRFALYAVTVYVLLPLGIGYSRAVHVDFCIIFFSVGYLYFGLLFFIRHHWRYGVLSCCCATLAFLMKAPYCFYLALPLLTYVMWEKAERRFKNIFYIGALFILPLVAAILFNMYRIALEANETDSLVYCMKWTPGLSRSLFFGHLSQRFDGWRWHVIIRRLIYWVFTPAGAFLALLSLCIPMKKKNAKAVLSLSAWCVGVLLYGLLVFPIFSSLHDYYSLPFLMPAALCIAPAVLYIVDGADTGSGRWYYKGARLLLVMTLLTLGSVRMIEKNDRFCVDWQRVICGNVIEEHTHSDDLILSVTLGRSTGWSDPRILYHAKRKGWAIELKSLTQDALKLYVEHGANVAALLMTPEYKLDKDNYGVLASLPVMDIVELNDDNGRMIGHVVLFEIRNMPR